MLVSRQAISFSFFLVTSSNHFFDFSHCQSTSISKLPFLVFKTVFRVALVEMTFSLRKDENLARLTFSKDTITMNLGKSAALGYETRILDLRVRFLSHCLFQVLSSSQIPILSTELTLGHRLLAPNR